MPPFDSLNRSGLAMLADPEAIIRERGGDDTMYATDPGKLRETNKWVDHARPFIVAMFAIEDAAHPLTSAWLAADKDRRFGQPLSWRQRDYDEGRREIDKARQALFDMLNGIRDAFLCDERCGIANTDDETEAADEFNDWLDASTITVDQAVQIVINEQDAARATRWAA